MMNEEDNDEQHNGKWILKDHHLDNYWDLLDPIEQW